MTTAQADNPDLPVITIDGERVALGPLRRDLLPIYQRWHNDFTVRRNTGRPYPWTLERATALHEQGAMSAVNAHFTIYALPDYQPIGTTHLFDIDFFNQRAEFGIVIGAAEFRGRGLGTEVTRLMLDYAFATLGLHNVVMTVNSYNLAGLRAYTKAGFREFGRRRESRRLGGVLHDVIYMDCLATDLNAGLPESEAATASNV